MRPSPAAAPPECPPCALMNPIRSSAQIRFAVGFQKERDGRTYMGHDYYPQWLDNLAADVTLEAAAMDGTARGAANVRSIVITRERAL